MRLYKIEIYNEGDTIDQVELVNCSDPYYPPEGWGCGICEGVFEPCANRWINALAGSPSENAVFISQRLSGWPYPGEGCEVTKLRMNEQENLVEDSVIGSFNENMFGMAVTPPARRPFVRLMGLDGRSRSVQTPFYPDSMYGDDVNKGFPVGYYLDNLSVDFSGGLSANEEDTIYVQVADYMSSSLTQDHTMNTRFASGNFVVEFFALPDLDDGIRETVTAMVTETRTGYVERVFHLHETGEASNYFTAQPVNMSLDWNHDEPSTATLFYVSNEVNSAFTISFVYDAELDLYVDNEEEPELYLMIVYSSGNLAEEPDAIAISFSEEGTRIDARLLETGNDTHTYAITEPGERTYLNQYQPHQAMFQITAYLPQEGDLVNVTVDAGAGVATVPLTRNDYGLHVSSPLVGIKSGGSCSDIPDVVSSDYYQCVGFDFGAAKDDQSSCGFEETITIWGSDGTTLFTLKRKKGGLFVYGENYNNQSKWLPSTLKYVANKTITHFQKIQSEIERKLDLPYIRHLIRPTRDEVVSVINMFSHFVFNGHGYIGPPSCENNEDYRFGGLYLGNFGPENNTQSYLRGFDFEDVPNVGYDFVFLNSCGSAKVASIPDPEVENLVNAFHSRIYVGHQNSTSIFESGAYWLNLIDNWRKYQPVSSENLLRHVDDYYKSRKAESDEPSTNLLLFWGYYAIFEDCGTANIAANCDIEKLPWFSQSEDMTKNHCEDQEFIALTKQWITVLPRWRPNDTECKNRWPVQ